MTSLKMFGFLLLAVAGSTTHLAAQKKQLLVDVAHGQKFYSDPAVLKSSDLVPTDRLKYMTGELAKNATAHNAVIGYIKSPITADVLSRCDLLFIQVPGQKYTAGECAVIRGFVERGGSLLIVIEEDYWATLAQINPNDIVGAFGITFGNNSPDSLSGGHSVPGKITKKKYSIPYHGARLVKGGTPFAYGNTTNSPFAVYTETKGGGKVVAMGEGMVSLYMTSWQGVTDYQCSEFMDDVIGWLLK